MSEDNLFQEYIDRFSGVKKHISEDIIAYEWIYVNVDNEFEFLNNTFKIDDSVHEYKVYNKYSESVDYLNNSSMDEILVTIDKNSNLKFYNQNLNEISIDNIIHVKG